MVEDILTITTNSAAYNGRFHASGGVCPQKHLCKFASFAPARTFVNPRLREAAGTLCVSGESIVDRVLQSENRLHSDKMLKGNRHKRKSNRFSNNLIKMVLCN